MIFRFVNTASATNSTGGWTVPTCPGCPDNTVAGVLLNLIGWSTTIIGLLGVIIFIYAGFTYLTAQGDTSRIEQAKKIVTYAIVGIAVSVLGLVAVKTVDSILSGKASSINNNQSTVPTTLPEGRPIQYQ